MALVAPHVGLHVHGQGGHRSVELATLSAAFAGVSMNLAMAGQIAAGGKLFATVWAALALLASSW